MAAVSGNHRPATDDRYREEAPGGRHPAAGPGVPGGWTRPAEPTTRSLESWSWHRIHI